MAIVRIVTWVFIGLLVLVTGYLMILNRGSEKVATNLPAALAVGLVGTLLTLLFSLQPEEKRVAFPVEYVIDPQTTLPFLCNAVPESNIYTDAGGLTTSPAWLVRSDLETAKPGSTKVTGDNDLQRFYRAIMFRQMLETLRFTYLKSWDARPSRFELPTGTSETVYAPNVVRPGTVVTNAGLITIFNGDITVGSTLFEFLNVPPDTKPSGKIGDDSSNLRFKNKFVVVDILITDRGVAQELGDLRSLCRIGIEDAKKYKRPRYFVTLTASFNEFRSGHVDMPLYRHWVDTMFGELQRFDSQMRWSQLRDKYLLLYANREKTPLQELMDETIQKAKSRKR